VRDILGEISDLEEQLASVFSKHLKAGNPDFRKQAKTFVNVLQWRPFSLYDRKKDLETLDRFVAGLSHLHQTVLEDLSPAARKRLDSRLRTGAANDDDSILDFMTQSDGVHAQTFYDAVERAEELRRLVEATRSDIEASPRTRRTLSVINVDRLQVVAIAAPLWARQNAADLPGKGIKETHALARFLADLFALLAMETSPTKAYDAWIAQT
jgi:hypothetical protein